MTAPAPIEPAPRASLLDDPALPAGVRIALLRQRVEFTTFADVHTPQGRRARVLRSGFVETLRNPLVRDSKAELPGWSFATFTDDRRSVENVERVYAVAFDYDTGNTSIDEAAELWGSYRGALHTTFSHAAEAPRFRVVVFMSRPVTAPEYRTIWNTLAGRAEAAGHVLDRACSDPSRFWFAPSHKPGAPYEVRELHGSELDVDAILEAGRDANPGERESGVFAVASPEASDRDRAYATEALARESEAVADAGPGTRNARLYEAALKLGGFIASGALQETEVRSTLANAGEAADLDADEIRRAITNGIEIGKASPRHAPADEDDGLDDRYDPAEWAALASRKQHDPEPAASAEPVDDPDHWDPPRPLDALPPVPEFPTDALPPVLREWVEAEATALQVPNDLPAILALGVVSAATAKLYQVQIDARQSEPLNTYWLVALPSGERKSPVVRDATEPIDDREAELAEARRAAIDDLEYRIDIAGADDDVTDLKRELAELRAKPARRWIADDITPERLAAMLPEHDGRMALISAEGGVFDTFAGRYSPSSTPNFDVLLKGYSGDALRVDRGGSGKLGATEIHVRRPAVTIVIAPQPDIIRGLAARPGARTKGLLARFAFVLPKSLVGYRKRQPPVPELVVSRYNGVVSRLLDSASRLESSDFKPTRLRLSREAAELFFAFEDEIEPQLRNVGRLGGIADWGNKLAGRVARVAGLLCAAELAGAGSVSSGSSVTTGNGASGASSGSSVTSVSNPGTISGETMQAAIQIGRYLIAHAIAAFTLMAVDPVVDDAVHILDWLRSKGYREFTLRMLHRHRKSRFHKPEDAVPALELLAEHGYIRPLQQESKPGRPPSPAFEVSPYVE